MVGSGLAGLTCAAELAAAAWDVLVVTAGRAGRDGATHRVHALAPWLLLTAPWVRGDTPARFLADLKRRAGGCEHGGLADVLAEAAHDAALALIEELDLEPMDGQPVALPGDEVARGLRCRPRRRHVFLAPALARCSDAGVRFRDRALVFGLLVGAGRALGAVVLHRDGIAASSVPADAVVLACGGSAAVFPVSTSPRWCRGTGLALAGPAGVLLHRPGLIQALPVTAGPPRFFPGSSALVRGRVEIAGRPLPEGRDLEHTALAVAEAERAGTPAFLESSAEVAAVLPEHLRAVVASRALGQLPLAVAQHHGIGGVAIDAWGRTSLPGLYACGEAAGGVQGRRRTMGTGLLEAAVFGKRAARAVVSDHRRDGFPQVSSTAEVAAIRLPLEPTSLERRLDEILGPLVLVRPADEVARALRELQAWPVRETTPAGPDVATVLAGIRLGAALAMLAGFGEDRVGEAGLLREREDRWIT